ncbi:MAG: ABC transporter ATP-binding protein [Actinomycetota bacterium]|nr:ABC transporter ATP-binding protein [Actinomycetota bacterium]
MARRYGGVEALTSVDLDIRAGELFCLLGPSGSGKTTLLRLIAGFEHPDGGRLSITGVPDGAPPERRDIGFVFHDYALFPHRTVAENVDFGLKMRGRPKADRRARVAEMLELVGLGSLGGRRPSALSAGQRQRVALARALAPAPRLLLLDEPLANLDRRLRESLRAELVRIHSTVGVTTVLVTHDQEEALMVADRVAVLRDGRLEQVGTPVELWTAPATRFVAGFVGEMNLLDAARDGEGTARVVALHATVAATGGGAAEDGLVACIRPEALRLSPPGVGVPGRIRAVAYAGGQATYRVALAGGPVVLAREVLADGRPGWSAGEEVGVSLRDVACRLLPA